MHVRVHLMVNTVKFQLVNNEIVSFQFPGRIIRLLGSDRIPSVGIRRNLSVGFDRPLLLINSFNKLVPGANFRGRLKPPIGSVGFRSDWISWVFQKEELILLFRSKVKQIHVQVFHVIIMVVVHQLEHLFYVNVKNHFLVDNVKLQILVWE